MQITVDSAVAAEDFIAMLWAPVLVQATLSFAGLQISDAKQDERPGIATMQCTCCYRDT